MTASSPSILITAFEPFGGEALNPSALILEKLRSLPGVDAVLLPVTFSGAFEGLQERLQKQDYDYILCLGQAGGRSKISLERIAINLIDTRTADEGGVTIHEQPILPGRPLAYMTSFSLREMAHELNSSGHSVEVSNSAGLFVCNYIYFQTLAWLEKNMKKTKAVFIHIPYCPEQMAGKPNGTPFMELTQMENCILDFINQCKALGAIR